MSLPNQFVCPVTGPSCRPEKIQLGLLAEGDAVMGRAHGGDEALHSGSVAVCLESQADVCSLHLSCAERKQHLRSCRRVVIIRGSCESEGRSLHQQQRFAAGPSFPSTVLPLRLRVQLDVA